MCYNDVIQKTKESVSWILTLPYDIMIAHINNVRTVDYCLYGKMLRTACKHYGDIVLIDANHHMVESDYNKLIY